VSMPASMPSEATPPAPTTGPRADRLIELDVVRGLALIGVCVMNYHGYMINDGGRYERATLVQRVFDPWTGPLSTRFAATFVTVAGMGIALLTKRSRTSGDRAAISADRWKLARRGVLLYAFGYFLNWVWDGTILFYYGAFFLAGGLLFTLRTRWLTAIGVAAAGAAAAIQWWALDRSYTGHDISWLLYRNATATRSPKDLVLDTFIRGTHPLLPWLVFLCIGIVLGRLLPFDRALRLTMTVAGAVLLAVGYLANHFAGWHPVLRSTAPFDRGVLYTITTVGSTLLAVSLLGWLAQLTAAALPTRALAAAGRTTLTLYVGHVLAYNWLVHRVRWVHPGGLGTALVFAAAYWAVAVCAATAWQAWRGIGPLEWVYRRFSDATR